MSSGPHDWRSQNNPVPEAREQPTAAPVDLTGEEKRFDVFLAYNSNEPGIKPLLMKVRALLKSNDQKPWLDDYDMLAGAPSTEILTAIRQSRCCAMLVGKEGLGPWQQRTELIQAIAQRNRDPDFRVFPVHLPGSSGSVDLPADLELFTWVDLRERIIDGELTEEGIARILAAVSGKTMTEYEDELARAAAAQPPRARRHRALLVHIANYDSPELENLYSPSHDAAGLQRALANVAAPSGKWEVASYEELNKAKLEDTLRDFIVDQATEDDTILFYFSGHGWAGDDGSYICAADTNPEWHTQTAVPASYLVQVLRKSPASEKIAILDCCHGALLQGTQFDSLDEHFKVIVASHGPAADGSPESPMSPFTRAVTEVLQNEDAYEDRGLTADRLVEGLRERGQNPGSYGKGGDIVVGASVGVDVPLPPSAGCDMAVDVSVGEARDRLELIRQLAIAVEGLLAVADDVEQLPDAWLRHTMKLLSDELCALVDPTQRDDLLARLNGTTERLTCAVRFVPDGDRALLIDLPWEYLALNLGAPTFPLAMHRTFTSTATRGSGGRKQIGWLSSLGIGPSPSAELLTKAARRELRDLELVAPVSFTEFRRLRNEYDVLILQAPIQLDGEKVKVIMAGSPGRGPIPVDAEKLTEQLADKSNLTWVVIETVANDCSMRTAQALRRLADELAQKIGRQVVALCHPRAYLHEFEIAETPNEEPPVFLVELLKQLPRTSLDDAAHIARKNVLRGWPLDEAGVGVPIVMRPQAPVAVAAEPSQRAGRRGPRL